MLYLLDGTGRSANPAGAPGRGRGAAASRSISIIRGATRGAAQVIENPVDQLGVCDEGDYPHCFAAAGTLERIDLEDTAQQLGPTPACLA